MKRKIYRIIALALTFSLTLTLLTGVTTASAASSTPSLTSRGAFILDCQTGQEIWSYNGDTSLVPASMTKVMAVYLVYEAMASGEISKSTKVPISSGVAAFSNNWEYSNVTLYRSVTYTVDELLSAVICYSACAATVALAELVAGSEEAFVAKMNETATSLGLTAEYYDCYGGSDYNRITARSMAYLAYDLITKYPDYLKYSSKTSFYFHGRTYSTTNSLVRGAYSFPGTADGIKTGTTTAAGYCLCSSVVKDGHRIITVTMHSSTGTNRYYDSIKLIKYGFNYIDGYLSRGYRYVSPTDCKIYVDGVEADIAGYMIDDNNYFRLRDLAAMLSGTDSTFQVTYDESSDAVNITTGEEYTALGTELQPIRDAKAFAIKNSPLLYANGESVSLSTYLIDDNNYVKLRDVAAITGFDVQWDEATNSVIITSTANENEDENTGSNPEPVLFMYETTAAVTAP